jgi:REP element-mobilizing transposase RayT
VSKERQFVHRVLRGLAESYARRVARKPRRLFLHGTFHVTSRGVARSTVYRDANDYRLFLVLLRDAVDRWDWDVHVMCLMPNHFHLVVGTTGPRLSAGLHRANGVYAQSFNARYDRSGHLFGDRFFTRMIESEDSSAPRAGTCSPTRCGPASASRRRTGPGVPAATASRSTRS